MIKWMINEIKLANEAVRKGNEYRAMLAQERADKAPAPVVEKEPLPRQDRMFMTKAELEEIENFKAKFGIIRAWTGARFVDGKNPNFDPVTGDASATCTFNMNTGRWEALQ